MSEGRETAARLRGSVNHIDLTVRAHDRYAAGLHHLAFHAADRADVDRAHALMTERGATILDPPAAYAQYGAGYHAVFLADPDGLKLEVVRFIGRPADG